MEGLSHFRGSDVQIGVSESLLSIAGLFPHGTAKKEE